MESFFYISQKLINPELDSYVYKNSDFEARVKQSKIFQLNRKEYNSTHNYILSEVLNNNRKIKKFHWLSGLLKNIFFTKELKEKLIEFFGKVNKNLAAFSRLAYLYKFKKAPVKIRTDIFLNPIKETDKNVMQVFDSQNLCKYLFTISDLIQIIKKSLMHSPNFFSDPSDCKNPYTNIPFNKSTLYNIYFYVKCRNYIMPQLFQNFFIENFDLEAFRKNNLYLIRESSIEDYVNNMDTEEAVDYIFLMIKNCYQKNIFISDEFPKKKLIEIMKPYLHYYFISLYSLSIEKKRDYFEKLQKKMKRFFSFNPKFGRKYVKMQFESTNEDGQLKNPFVLTQLKKKQVVTFCDVHINFNETIEENFLTSHIKNKEDEDEDEDENYYQLPHINANANPIPISVGRAPSLRNSPIYISDYSSDGEDVELTQIQAALSQINQIEELLFEDDYNEDQYEEEDADSVS